MQESKEVMQSKIEEFNKKHPVGSRVTLIKDKGEKFRTTIKYCAEVLSGHTAVIWLNGISGCYDLNRVVA